MGLAVRSAVLVIKTATVDLGYASGSDSSGYTR